MNPQSAQLRGSWTHSFEEDEAGVQVYRPTSSFALLLDRQRSTRASLTPLGMNRFSLGGTAQAPGKVIEIVEARADMLRLRWL